MVESGYRSPADRAAEAEHEKRHAEHEKAIASLNTHWRKESAKYDAQGKELGKLRDDIRRVARRETLKSLKELLVTWAVPAVLGVVAIAYLSIWHRAWMQAQRICVPGVVEKINHPSGVGTSKYNIWSREVICVNGNQRWNATREW
jgi:ferric-dicitrate binding protein FerR (iron transport regulator)